MLKVVFISVKAIVSVFNTTGIICCLCYIALSNSAFGERLRKKQRSSKANKDLHIDYVQLPEMAKKLQQSFK